MWSSIDLSQVLLILLKQLLGVKGCPRCRAKLLNDLAQLIFVYELVMHGQLLGQYPLLAVVALLLPEILTFFLIVGLLLL